MEETLGILTQLAKDRPGVFLVAFCFFIYMFKDNIIIYLKDKFNIKLPDKLGGQEIKGEHIFSNPQYNNILIDSYTVQAFVYYFAEKVQVFDLEQGIEELQSIIDIQRKKHRKLVFNLADTRTLIEHAKDAFLIVLRKVIEENNIDFLLILPNKINLSKENRKMKALIAAIENEIKNNPTEAIKVRVDRRGKVRLD